MFKKISILVLAFYMVTSSAYAARKAESLEEGIEQLAIDISSQMKAKGVKKIAIDDFTDLNGYKSALGDFISEELVTNFYTQGAGSFDVVERRELARVLKEQKLGSSGLLDKATIAKVGQVLGIDAIVTGSIAYLGRSIKVNARMLGVNDAKVFAATSQKMPKDETVEALLSQSGRVIGSTGITSSIGAQAQSFDTVFQNDFLIARPTLFVKTEDGFVLNIEFQNKSKQVLNIASICFQDGNTPDVSLVGNMGFALKGQDQKFNSRRISTTGILCMYESRYGNELEDKSNYTEIRSNSKTTAAFRFKFESNEDKSNVFIFNISMAKHSGNGKKYSKFMIGIPGIRLKSVN